MCPCWFDEDPDENECTGVVAWYVEQGRIDRIDVSGLMTVSVSHHGGHRRKGRARVALFVDERADDKQQNALVNAFTGKLGGPLRDLAQLTDKVTEVERAKIDFTSDGRSTKLKIGRKLATNMDLLVGETSRVIGVVDSAMAELLGTPAEVGKSTVYRVALGHDQLDLDVRGRSANRGRFVYRTGRA
jgi:hypothetical protein